MSNTFIKGQVYTVYFPKPKYDPEVENHVNLMPKPHTVIYGKHKAIVLANPDSTGKVLSANHVHVVAISSARSAVENGNLLATHVPLKKELHSFLDHDSFALAFQIITVPSHWLTNDNYVGEIESKTMSAITIATLLSTGSWEYVQAMVDKLSEQKFAQFLEEYEDASTFDDASADE